MAAPIVQESIPPALEASSPPPPLFDGTTRLYTSLTCPFAQRVWITRNYKGLQEKIKLVPINLQNRPDWYKEKVNPANKVPALEHDGKVVVESLDLIKYVDSHFEGPSLYPNEPAKREFGEELLAYVGQFTSKIFGSFKGGEAVKVADAEFDYLEKALQKFGDGPFFLGQFSLGDIAYASLIDGFRLAFADVWKCEITAGRPNLAAWVEELNKIEAYKQTKADPKEILEHLKKHFMLAGEGSQTPTGHPEPQPASPRASPRATHHQSLPRFCRVTHHHFQSVTRLTMIHYSSHPGSTYESVEDHVWNSERISTWEAQQ